LRAISFSSGGDFEKSAVMLQANQVTMAGPCFSSFSPLTGKSVLVYPSYKQGIMKLCGQFPVGMNIFALCGRPLWRLVFVFVWMAVQAQTFSPISTNNLALAPYALAAGDVNADGSVDLLCAAGSGGTYSFIVLTNDGVGNLTSNASFSISAAPAFTVADVNRDLAPDVLLTGTLLRTNNGVGQFSTPSIYSAPPILRWMCSADINRDGWQDIVSGGFDYLIVQTNCGNGSFSNGYSATFSLLPAPVFQQVILGDVTGDGQPELIGVGNEKLVVLTNSIDGAFAVHSTNATPYNWPGKPCVVDVDGDGKLDVVVPDYGSGSGRSFMVLTNAGGGILDSNRTFVVTNAIYASIAADLDGQYGNEIVVMGGQLTIYTNTDLGGYDAGFFTPAFGSPASYRDAVAADFNGDGKADLAVAFFSQILLFFNTTPSQAPVVLPSLEVNATEAGVKVSWPSSSPGWHLQQSFGLAPPDWAPGGYNGYPVIDDGLRKSLSFAPVPAALYFRLFHP
jgi:hypothetical protein